MDNHLDFTPQEVRADWNRFGHCWVQLVNSQGQDTGDGLLELWTVDPVRTGSSWRSAHVILKKGNGEYVEYDGLPSGTHIRFAPKWKHKGYTMVTPINRMNEEGSPYCSWISLTSVRQYRYGLSDRAFSTRPCSSMFELGTGRTANFLQAACIFNAGPRFLSYAELLPRKANAISASLGLHPATEDTYALCWNARVLIGFMMNGALKVERRSESLTKSLPSDYRRHTEYVTTEELTDIFQEQILPRSMEWDTPPEPAPSLRERPRLRPGGGPYVDPLLHQRRERDPRSFYDAVVDGEISQPGTERVAGTARPQPNRRRRD